jgi:Nif-specific regulatory protein
MRQVRDLVLRVAPTDATVLIRGETGTGKELTARAIHRHSARCEGPFVPVNCAAIADSLLESELFGYVKGAFTGADSDKSGLFELADGGTIFLDEIGDIPASVQAKMLRVLQEQTFEPVGASEPVRVNVRIIAATNKDIEQAVEDGGFRRDLYYRLNVLPLYIPPLRERKEDIPVLATHFLKKVNRETKKQVRGFSDAAMQELLSYSWPGNVRELQNAVERAVVITQDDYIQPGDLILQPTQKVSEERFNGRPLKESVNLFKKHLIQTTLEKNDWNQTATAKVLGIQRTYLSRLIKDLDISH